ncbi:expressed unknown protein [Seminavis robusta]|uniref:Uncharacterized protein n=1 Tax=Seminavis robusta TaxID=568900 RepID=A0A9N8EDW0_9STRA|nr:expressed unknown protein [Seminavis robusta]|eukprot:Sro859_g211940.1 n/a (447) ;mRNA; f:12041-13381
MTHHHHSDSYYYHHTQEDGTLSSQFHAAILDHEFLLRAATTHDWDTLTAFCQFLEEIFTLSVPDRVLQWQKNRIQCATQQLVATDQWGNTALHVACYNTPPARAVRALLTAASAVSPSPLQIHTMRSRDHSTPLLVACATGASLQVIQALLDPPAGLVPGGAMVCQADQTGATPLTELAVHYEIQRKSPAHVRHNRPLDQVQLIRDFSSQMATVNDDDDDNHTRRRNNNTTLLDTFQAKLELLFKAAWSAHFPSMMISMVHGLAHVAAYCPPVVTRLILRGYPHMISYPNRHGVLPLHLTVATRKRFDTNTNNPTVFWTRHAYCVEQLLQAYPQAAREQWKGRSPFVQAIASGYFWSTATASSKNSNKKSNSTNNNTKGPLQLLWQAAPESLAEMDPVTKLCPVQLASATFAAYSVRISPQEHVLQLDTIYNLLRANPQVLKEEFV